jgi:predicted RNase H-like nuclease (RuvC/YqgF family)
MKNEKKRAFKPKVSTVSKHKVLSPEERETVKLKARIRELEQQIEQQTAIKNKLIKDIHQLLESDYNDATKEQDTPSNRDE